jgi:bifunctional ADP-heptose synthase (sugar kinase/adenylyltransferase)
MLTTDLVERILSDIPDRTIGLIGDLFLDRYFDIDVSLNEPSVETGLTAYQVTSVRCYPGALGTVLNNLAALGVGQIHPITVIGDDGEGYELRRALERLPAVVADDLIGSPDRRTPTYTKPMLIENDSVREMNRLDIKNRTPTSAALQDQLLRRIRAAWDTFDAVIVLDQVSEAECGVVTTRIREQLAQWAERDPNRFVLADSRERIGLFRNVCVKPNLDECRRAVWVQPPPRFTDSDDTFAPLELSRLVNGPTFLTLGSQGIAYVPRPIPNGPLSRVDIPAYPVSGPIDICGAGDSCSAGIACAMMAGATPEQAAAFGNLVASITVQQIGVTGTATPEQVRARWQEVSGTGSSRKTETP